MTGRNCATHFCCAMIHRPDPVAPQPTMTNVRRSKPASAPMPSALEAGLASVSALPSSAPAMPAVPTPPRRSGPNKKREQDASDADDDSVHLTPAEASAASEAEDEDDRGVGVPLFGLFSAAGVAGVAMLASGGSASGASSGQPPVGGDVGVTPPTMPPTTPPPSETPSETPSDTTPDTNPDTNPETPPGASPDDTAKPEDAAHPDDPDHPGNGEPPLPPPPKPGQVVIHLPNDTGASALDHITADGTLHIQVEGADPDTTIRIERSPDGGKTWEVVTDPSAPWPDGEYLVQAVVSNAGGDSTTPAASLTIDTQAPDVAELVVSGAPVQGDVQLSMNGVDAGAAVAYEVSVDQGQTWHRTHDVLSTLMDGHYQFRGVVTDAAGNQRFTAAQTVTVDTEPPAPLTLQLRKVGEQGFDASSALSCTGDVNLKLALPAGVTARYEQSSDGGDTWTAVTSTVRGLPEGRYSFRAFLQDAAGNETAVAPVTLTVDRTPPVAPVIYSTLPAIDGDPANGYLSSDGSYSVVLSHIDPSVRISFFMREAGTDTWKPTSSGGQDLLDGRYEYRVGFQDAAGNFSYSNIVEFQVDTSRPGAGTITLADFTDDRAGTTSIMTRWTTTSPWCTSPMGRSPAFSGSSAPTKGNTG